MAVLAGQTMRADSRAYVDHTSDIVSMAAYIYRSTCSLVVTLETWRDRFLCSRTRTIRGLSEKGRSADKQVTTMLLRTPAHIACPPTTHKTTARISKLWANGASILYLLKSPGLLNQPCIPGQTEHYDDVLGAKMRSLVYVALSLPYPPMIEVVPSSGAIKRTRLEKAEPAIPTKRS